jgi:ComF family protein
LRQLIHILKYEGVASLAKPLASLMLRGLPRDVALDAVAAVPMHWWKRYRRGFNQAELLATEVSRATGLPRLSLLRRARWMAAQAGLGSAERRRNATAAFSLMPRRTLSGRRILLVDDVFTTGATAMACARLLKQGGASYVAVLTIARVDRRAPAPLYQAEPRDD